MSALHFIDCTRHGRKGRSDGSLECPLCEDDRRGRVTRNFPIDLPAGSVDANGDAIVPGVTDLPICEPERPGETVVDHGARVLLFLMETSCTATLSDVELERADLAAHYAIVAREILPAAATRISEVRHVIALVLRSRQQEESVAIVLGGQLEGKAGIGGPGDREPLEPRPKQNPPAGAYAVPDRIAF